MGKEVFMLNPHTLDKMLSDYHWMVTTLADLEEENKTVSASTSKYGLEATMPKGNDISNPVHGEYLRREKRISRIEEYRAKVSYIQSVIDVINTDRESEVLYWMLEGKSMRWISKRMGLSHVSIQGIRDNIVEMMLQASMAS